MGLGIFFYVERWWNCVEIRSGGRFMVSCYKFLSITYDFQRNYLMFVNKQCSEFYDLSIRPSINKNVRKKIPKSYRE